MFLFPIKCATSKVDVTPGILQMWSRLLRPKCVFLKAVYGCELSNLARPSVEAVYACKADYACKAVYACKTVDACEAVYACEGVMRAKRLMRARLLMRACHFPTIIQR